MGLAELKFYIRNSLGLTLCSKGTHGSRENTYEAAKSKTEQLHCPGVAKAIVELELTLSGAGNVALRSTKGLSGMDRLY